MESTAVRIPRVTFLSTVMPGQYKTHESERCFTYPIANTFIAMIISRPVRKLRRQTCVPIIYTQMTAFVGLTTQAIAAQNKQSLRRALGIPLNESMQ